LLPQDPVFQTVPGEQLVDPGPTGYVATMRRFLNEVRLDYFWFPGSGPDELGINDAGLNATFAIPLSANLDTPLLVTPGFGVHLWNGPEPSTTVDMPPRTYDAYLQATWNPQPTPWLGAELAFRIGVYSDFTHLISDSIRYMGHGLAVFSFSPSFQVKAGVMYLDRNVIKMLPTGGIVWTPSSDARFEILFPNPKLAMRLTTIGNTEWWWYVRGNYGGNSWTVKRTTAPYDGVIQKVDYNDLRVALGLEFDQFTGMKGLFEVGFAFERELVYKDATPRKWTPNNTVFLRGGLFF